MMGIEVDDTGLHRAAHWIDIRLCRSIMIGDASESEFRDRPSDRGGADLRACFEEEAENLIGNSLDQYLSSPSLISIPFLAHERQWHILIDRWRSINRLLEFM